MAIELLEDVHEYRVDGRTLIGVTSALKTAGLLRGWGDAADLERGKQVHRAIKMWFDKKLAPEQPEWLGGYILGLERFVAECWFVPIEWEAPVADPVGGFAGTPDVFGTMRGQHLECCADFKTGRVEKWTAIQTAAYVAAKKKVLHRIGVSLPGDGTYHCTPYPIKTLAYHKDIFYSCLKIAKFQAEK
jgi:hypothetical protein